MPLTAGERVEARQRFPHAARIRSTKDILALLRSGRPIRTRALDLYSLDNAVGRPRLGVIVPKYGHRNVERNRLKRRIREMVRRSWLTRRWAEGSSTDLLVRARPPAYGLSAAELAEALEEALADV